MGRSMNSGLYKAATAGDVLYLPSETDTVSSEEIRNSVTDRGDNCLHIASRFGHEEFARRVLRECPSLLQQNKRGDNPLHVAARAGHFGVVKLLTDCFQQCCQNTGRTGNKITAGGAEEGKTKIQKEEKGAGPHRFCPCPAPASPNSSGNSATTGGGDIILDMTQGEADEEGENSTNSIQPPPSSQSFTVGEATWITSQMPIWRTKNDHGSTALHEALRGKHEDVTLHLLDLDGEPVVPDSKTERDRGLFLFKMANEQIVFVVNGDKESLLYLAAKAGFVSVVTKIVNILKILTDLDLNFFVSDVGPNDQKSLHAAVFAGSAECIEVLHGWSPELIKERDSYGKTALYYATQANSLEIMRLLLQLDASSACIRDNEGLSPLLVAASVGVPASVRAILDACPISVESVDDSGHNALHLALKNNTVERFQELLGLPEVITLINEPNRNGNTPYHLAVMHHKYYHVLLLLSTERVDLAAKNNDGKTALDLCASDSEPSALERLILNEMKRRNAPRGQVSPVMLHPDSHLYNIGSRLEPGDRRQVINTLSVVAALLATMTSAAAFTIPGGYKGDGPNMGSPSLIHKKALKLFFISDTIALCCSMVALLLLVSATISDRAFIERTIDFCRLLVVAALYAAMITIISGLYAVISIESVWLAIVVCITGLSFHFLYEWLAVAASAGTPLAGNPFLRVRGFLKRQVVVRTDLLHEHRD